MTVGTPQTNFQLLTSHLSFFNPSPLCRIHLSFDFTHCSYSRTLHQMKSIKLHAFHLEDPSCSGGFMWDRWLRCSPDKDVVHHKDLVVLPCKLKNQKAETRPMDYGLSTFTVFPSCALKVLFSSKSINAIMQYNYVAATEFIKVPYYMHFQIFFSSQSSVE